MHPLAEVHVFVVEEVAFVQEAHLVEEASGCHPAGQGQPVDLRYAAVIEVGHQVASGERVARQQAREDRVAVEEDDAEGWEAATGQLERAVFVQDPGPEDAHVRVLAQISGHGREDVLVELGVRVEEGHHLTAAEPDALVEGFRQAGVARVAHQADGRELASHHVGAAVLRGVVYDYHLVFQFKLNGIAQATGTKCYWFGCAWADGFVTLTMTLYKESVGYWASTWYTVWRPDPWQGGWRLWYNTIQYGNLYSYLTTGNYYFCVSQTDVNMAAAVLFLSSSAQAVIQNDIQYVQVWGPSP